MEESPFHMRRRKNERPEATCRAREGGFPNFFSGFPLETIGDDWPGHVVTWTCGAEPNLSSNGREGISDEPPEGECK